MLFADPELASWLAARLAAGRPDSGVDGSNAIDTWRKHKPPGRKTMIIGEGTRKEAAMQKNSGRGRKRAKMKDVEPQPTTDALVESKSKVDIEAVIEQIWNDLNGTTSRSEIRKVITELAPLYEDVRITTYVPIFLRRDVLRRFSQYQRAMVAESNNRRLEEIANGNS